MAGEYRSRVDMSRVFPADWFTLRHERFSSFFTLTQRMLGHRASPRASVSARDTNRGTASCMTCWDSFHRGLMKFYQFRGKSKPGGVSLLFWHVFAVKQEITLFCLF